MEIKRDIYLEQLKIRKNNGMIKIITGIRRCGKSFLLFVLYKKYLLENGVDKDHIGCCMRGYNMIVYITDETLTEIGVIDHGSVIWTQKYNDLGEFEITVPATLELLNLFRSGVFALREESKSVMMIEKIQTKTNPESGDYIVVTGRSTEALLNRRIVWEQTNIDNYIGPGVDSSDDRTYFGLITHEGSTTGNKIRLSALKISYMLLNKKQKLTY